MMIEPLANQHCDDIANLHLTYLPTPFKGHSGKKLLSLYYQSIIKSKGSIGYIASNEKGQVQGYICGIWNPQELRNTFIKTFWHTLLFWGILQLVTTPRSLLLLMHRFSPRSTPPSNIIWNYELRPIVIAKEAQGKNVASALVHELIKNAKTQGFSSIQLITEKTNLRANAFYQKMGFELIELTNQPNLEYNYYQRTI